MIGQARAGLSVVICTRRRPESLSRFLDSLRGQSRTPDALLIVDASPERDTERIVAGRDDLTELAHEVRYRRVGPTLTGLTRQRNFGLRHVQTDLVVFFDDDVVLQEACIAEMETLMRSDPGLVGVGAVAWNERNQTPSRLWRIRRRLGIVNELEPGGTAVRGCRFPGDCFLRRPPIHRPTGCRATR